MHLQCFNVFWNINTFYGQLSSSDIASLLFKLRFSLSNIYRLKVCLSVNDSVYTWIITGQHLHEADATGAGADTLFCHLVYYVWSVNPVLTTQQFLFFFFKKSFVLFPISNVKYLFTEKKGVSLPIEKNIVTYFLLYRELHPYLKANCCYWLRYLVQMSQSAVED